tara:strand:- start:9470 stop:10480 length:1011 start_codon:yes stop_codon:yes gene_type:complete
VKIVFWGTPQYAADNLLHIIDTGHDVVAVVTQPDRKRNRGNKLSPSPVKQIALRYDIPVYETHSISKDQITKDVIFNLSADVFIIVAFGQILPKEILDHPKLGCWNSHASLLPIWRGAAPIQWSLINDDEKTGICIMAMEEGLDTGPIIEQESLSINKYDNLEILTKKLSKLSSKLLVKSLIRIEKTEGLNRTDRLKELNAIDQTNLNGNPTYARQIKKEDYIINWDQSGWKIIKKINGLYPNAYTFYNGKRIKIFEAVLLENTTNIDELNQLDDNIKVKNSVGEIIRINQNNGLTIMTKDYPILIKFGQLEGKKRTDAYTLSKQCNLSIKNILGE